MAQASAASANPQPLPPGLDTRFIDPTADPCVDFAQYACGNFEKLHPIPKDRSGYGPGAIIAEHTEAIMHAMLETAADGGAKRTPNEQKIGDFYASCVDTAAIDRDGLKPLQAELDRIANLKSKDELPELFAHFQLINDTAWFNFGEQQDFKDARKQIAVVAQGGLGLPERDYYFRTGDAAEKTRTQYVQHITNILKLMGEPEAAGAADAQEIMHLETALAKVSMDITSQRDPKNIYHLMPVSQLATLAPGIAWDRFLKASGAPPISELNVTNPDFFKGMNALLASTDLETVKTYLRWQLIHATDSLVLPQPFADEIFDFYRHKLAGQPEQRARWKRCVQATDQAVGEALGQIYVGQEFPPSSKQATVQMVHDIEAAMDQEIDTLTWMSAATKTRAKEKLHAVADKIGYPDHWRDYSTLTIARGDAFGNAQRAVEFENRRELAKIGQPVDRGEWGMSPATVDAYYSSSMNDINFPAGILQSPIYDPHATDAENYGHGGAIVGMN
jgi:endothelin-converting enzyme/putative endopeptidase